MKGKNKIVSGSTVHVEVNVTKIVKYVCIAGVLIVGCIFGTSCFKEYVATTNKDEDEE